MQIENTEIRWGTVQQTLHWLVVLLVATQLVVGFRFGEMSSADPHRAATLHLHATMGMTIFLLMAFRLFWRRSYPVPRLPDTLTPTEKTLAHGTHMTLYLVLLSMPIVGYLLVNAHGHSVPFFRTELPPVIGESVRRQYSLLGLHIAGAYVLLMLLGVHIAAAMRHAWSLRDGVMERMAPFIRPSNRQAARIQAGEPPRQDQDGARAHGESSAPGQDRSAQGETGKGHPQGQAR